LIKVLFISVCLRNSLKSVDQYAPEIFNSPWAIHKSDEDLFNQTLKTVGEIVKDDVKLGTLYVTLVLATPGEELSQEAKVFFILKNLNRLKLFHRQIQPLSKSNKR
jgi:hypothetical protein